MASKQKRSKWQLRRKLAFRLFNPARYVLDVASLKHSGFPNANSEEAKQYRILLISDDRVATSEEQFNPFSLCRTLLRDSLNLATVHLLLDDVMLSPKLLLKPFDIIILKLSFRTDAAEAINVVRSISNAIAGRRLIYFDGDDDLCVQWPEILGYADLYVKKHMFRDRNQYLNRFVGKSNLTDYVNREYDFSFAEDPVARETRPVPKQHLSKLSVFCNLATDRNIVKLYQSVHASPMIDEKKYDIVFRGNVPNDWMIHLRKRVGPALERLGKRYVVLMPTSRVSIEQYYLELKSSKICVSPFGYGEICWRDFEAVLCGCLLVKPNMDHVETRPDIFQPHKTYVPVRWDFADLDEVCSHYLEHDHERQRIVAQAFNVLDEFYRGDDIVKATHELLDKAINRV
jgi:hypothetical protein